MIMRLGYVFPGKRGGYTRKIGSQRRRQREDSDYWEREFFDHTNAVTARDINENPGEYIFRCDFVALKELIDIKPELGRSRNES